MRWLADENLHAGLVRALRFSGHDVLYAAEHLRRDADRALLERAFREGRLMLTEDKDFGEIVFREGIRATGVVLLRIPARDRTLKWNRLRALIDGHGDALHGCFTVVGPSDIRMQPLQQT
jgi:predicted nuclease of predicted toxin-antitoxin system